MTDADIFVLYELEDAELEASTQATACANFVLFCKTHDMLYNVFWFWKLLQLFSGKAIIWIREKLPGSPISELFADVNKEGLERQMEAVKVARCRFQRSVNAKHVSSVYHPILIKYKIPFTNFMINTRSIAHSSSHHPEHILC